MIAFVVAVLLAAAPADEKSFVSGLADVKKLEAVGDWSGAKKRLAALLEENREQPWVRAHRDEVVDHTRRIALRLAVPPPDPATLVSGKLVKWDRATGEITLTYTPKQMKDFKKIGAQLRHPVFFEGPCSIEIEAAGMPFRNMRQPFVIGGAEHADRAYSAAVHFARRSPDHDTRNDVKGGCELREMVARQPNVVATLDHGPEADPKWTLKLEVTADSVLLSSGGTTLLKAPKAKNEWGCFSVPRMESFDLITLHGKATASWIDGLVEAEKGARESKFLDKYDVVADLPDWLK